MVTTTKVEFSEASKWVNSDISIVSDEMTPEEVLVKAEEIANQAQLKAQTMTLRKLTN